MTSVILLISISSTLHSFVSGNIPSDMSHTFHVLQLNECLLCCLYHDDDFKIWPHGISGETIVEGLQSKSTDFQETMVDMET